MLQSGIHKTFVVQEGQRYKDQVTEGIFIFSSLFGIFAGCFCICCIPVGPWCWKLALPALGCFPVEHAQRYNTWPLTHRTCLLPVSFLSYSNVVH